MFRFVKQISGSQDPLICFFFCVFDGRQPDCRNPGRPVFFQTKLIGSSFKRVGKSVEVMKRNHP